MGFIDLFSNPSSLTQAIDLVLAGIQDALDGESFGKAFPVVGDNLKDAAGAILYSAISGDKARALIEHNDADFATVRNFTLRDVQRPLCVERFG